MFSENWKDKRRAAAGRNYMEFSAERIVAEIDLGAILYNMESMKKGLSDGAMICAVLKTNAYGHGAVGIARVLEEVPYVWGYACAAFEEAAELREAGMKKPILLLGYVFPSCYEDLARLDIRPAVFREDMLDQLSEAAERAGRSIRVHAACDTGMGRIGIRPDETGLAFLDRVLHTKGLILEGMFTHFSRADEAGGEANTRGQIRAFRGLAESCRKQLGYRIPILHCLNSAGIISYADAEMDMSRAGITLYGLWPSGEVPRDVIDIRPVMSLRSRLVFVKEVEAGFPVSYGSTFVTDKRTRIATVPVGYGDGYPRSLSGRGYVLVRGKKAPILGRVCMDQFMIDVTDIPEAAEGDRVTLIGRDGDEVITMEELGDLSGRFNYELACCISQKRVPRTFINPD